MADGEKSKTGKKLSKAPWAKLLSQYPQMLSPAAVEDVKREVQLMKAVSASGHENVVKFYNAMEDEDYVYIVMEFCEGGGLMDRVLSNEEEAVFVVRQMLKIVVECHLQGVVHRDMKLEKVLFKSAELDSPLNVTEFGFSNIIKPEGCIFKGE